MVLIAIIFNTSVAKQLPMVQIVLLVVHVVGLFAIIITLLAMAPARNSGTVALLDFYNGGNWKTTGLATMIGLLTPLGSMLGFDCAVHMCKSFGTGLLMTSKAANRVQRKRSETLLTPSPDLSSGA